MVKSNDLALRLSHGVFPWPFLLPAGFLAYYRPLLIGVFPWRYFRWCHAGRPVAWATRVLFVGGGVNSPRKRNAGQNGAFTGFLFVLFRPSTARSDEWPAWFAGCWRALATWHGVGGFCGVLSSLSGELPTTWRQVERTTARKCKSPSSLFVCFAKQQKGQTF